MVLSPTKNCGDSRYVCAEVIMIIRERLEEEERLLYKATVQGRKVTIHKVACYNKEKN